MKNKKKLVILTIILILMQISIFSGNVIAEIVDGSKDGISWSYDSETKKLTFSGSGTISSKWMDGINKNELTSVEILDGVTDIDMWSFKGCSSLTSIKIPNSVTKIDTSAFGGCTVLTNIVVSEDNQSYSSENGILYNKDKTTLVCYPGGREETTYEIPNGVTDIGTLAFEDCTSLTNVKIPQSVKRISNAFNNGTSITSIVVSEDNQSYSSENGILYNKDKTVLVRCPEGRKGAIHEIPNSITSIDWNAFKSCSSITSIEIPNSVTSIGLRCI